MADYPALLTRAVNVPGAVTAAADIDLGYRTDARRDRLLELSQMQENRLRKSSEANITLAGAAEQRLREGLGLEREKLDVYGGIAQDQNVRAEAAAARAAEAHGPAMKKARLEAAAAAEGLDEARRSQAIETVGGLLRLAQGFQGQPQEVVAETYPKVREKMIKASPDLAETLPETPPENWDETVAVLGATLDGLQSPMDRAVEVGQGVTGVDRATGEPLYTTPSKPNTTRAQNFIMPDGSQRAAVPGSPEFQAILEAGGKSYSMNVDDPAKLTNSTTTKAQRTLVAADNAIGIINTLKPLITTDNVGAKAKIFGWLGQIEEAAATFTSPEESDVRAQAQRWDAELDAGSERIASHIGTSGSDVPASDFTNPNIPRVNQLANQLAYTMALMNSDYDRVSNQDYEAAKATLPINDLLGGPVSAMAALDQFERSIRAQRQTAAQALGQGLSGIPGSDSAPPKPIDEMSDDELEAEIRRLEGGE